MKLFKAINSSAILTGFLLIPSQAIAEDATWEQIAVFANEAWSRGDAVAACRIAIHAAHIINKEGLGVQHEVPYMRDYVAKYCGAL